MFKMPQTKKYTLESFTTSPTNKLAYTVAQSVVEGNQKYNPIFMYGPTSSGKTHLLRSIEQKIRTKGRCRVLYETEEDLKESLVKPARTEGWQRSYAEDRYFKYDLVMIDDIYTLKDMPATQSEFVYFLHSLLKRDKQVICASLRSPKELPKITDYIRHSCASGIILSL